MRILLSHFIVFSLLFMSLDGAADRVSVGDPHDDGTARLVDGSATDTCFDGEHGEHGCHGHVAGISVSFVVSVAAVGPADPQYSAMPYMLNYAQAPPTPPPNT